MRKFDSVQHSVYYFCNKPKKKIKCESISFMSGLPIAVVLLNRSSKYRDICTGLFSVWP